MSQAKTIQERQRFTLLLPVCLQTALAAEAKERGMSAQTMAQKILATVIIDRLYDAVLDEDREAADGKPQ